MLNFCVSFHIPSTVVVNSINALLYLFLSRLETTTKKPIRFASNFWEKMLADTNFQTMKSEKRLQNFELKCSKYCQSRILFCSYAHTYIFQMERQIN